MMRSPECLCLWHTPRVENTIKDFLFLGLLRLLGTLAARLLCLFRRDLYHFLLILILRDIIGYFPHNLMDSFVIEKSAVDDKIFVRKKKREKLPILRHFSDPQTVHCGLKTAVITIQLELKSPVNITMASLFTLRSTWPVL